MPEIKLKPCQFCGGVATTEITVLSPCTRFGFSVCCRSCEIKICYKLNGNSFDEADKAMIKAVELWNRRAENETD